MCDKVNEIFTLLTPKITDTTNLINYACEKKLDNVDELLTQIVTCNLDTRPKMSHIRGDAETEAKACFVVNA